MLIISARRWFQSLYGNTYHSVTVTNPETGKTVSCPFAYGYGDQYKQTAWEIAKKDGFIPEDQDYFTFINSEGGNYFTVSDVARKKDL